MRVRSVVKTRSGDTLYGQFQELTDGEYMRAKDALENTFKYITVVEENGDEVIVQGDDISWLRLEKSKA